MSTSPAGRPVAGLNRTGITPAGTGPAGFPAAASAASAASVTTATAATTASAAGQATELLAIRVRADQDVLGRVAAVIAPSARRDRTLWLFFLSPDGSHANLVVPIDDIPDRPAASQLGNVCYVATESIAHAWPGGSVVITLSRPGALKITDSDRHILRALQHGASVHGTPVRMLCLATPQGVRELGPVTPIR
jgi:hypothetical protein